MRRFVACTICFVLWVTGASTVASQVAVAREVNRDSVSIHFVDADIRAVLRGLAPYLAKPVLAGELPAARVSLETATPVPRSQVVQLLSGMLKLRGMTWEEDSAFYRVTQQPTAPSAPPSSAQSDTTYGLHVISLKHARATDVAATLNILFGMGGQDFSARRGLGTPTLTDELRRAYVPSTPQQTAANAQGPSAISSSLKGPVSLVPDERTNALLLRSSDADAEVIRRAVQQVDARPLQVLIEVLIVELRKDRSFDLGVTASAKREKGSTTESATLDGVSPGGLVMRFMRMSRTEIDLQLSAATARGDASIVSRPVILASNNAEAHFLVGSQRPFVQVSRSLPTENAVRDQVVTYRDVGTKLVVRPSINQDGYVALLVQQEISSATDETQFGAPVISTREAATEVLVRDGQTIVIGGLTDSTRTRAQSGIPVLSSIPLLGGLFGAAKRRSNATEVYLFLTPRVIRTDAEADSLTIPRLPLRERPDSTKRP